MKAKWRRRCLTFLTALMAGFMMSQGLPELASDLSAIAVFADESTNIVRFGSTQVECNDANLVYVDLLATGTPGNTITATYRTSSGTAIENIDYAGVYNTISLKLGSDGKAKYTISIKGLNDASGREKLRVYDSEGVYGRYFNLHLLAAENASIGDEKQCKCYLSYNYKVAATTRISDAVLGREVAYLNDYKTMLSKYHKGDNDISGQESWRTWKEGVSFDGDTTRHWVNTYINTGLAEAYGTYILKSIDDDKVHSENNIYMISGNKEFMDKYEKKKYIPGASLYYEIEPCKKGGYRLDGRAMYLISENKNPYKEDSDLVDLEEMHHRGAKQRVYWIQESDAWYSSKNSVYDTVFWKTEPYNGVLDYGLCIFNNNGSWDREVHDIWLFLTLLDKKAPSIVNQWSEYNPQTKSVRIYLRFDEPVYSSKKKDLLVHINNKTTNYYATYVEGNYGDTLVYELPESATRNKKIESIKYELPTEDIGDLSYNLDSYKMVRNNLVQGTDVERDTVISGDYIDLALPQLTVDQGSSLSPQAVYNIMISANGNGSTTFDTGTVYYSWDKNESIPSPTDPTSYANSHVLTSEESGSFGVTLMKNESVGVDSGDYYLHALAVSRYGLTAHNTFGPYRLDGDAPEISQIAPSVDELKLKGYRLQIKDKALGTSMKYVTMNVKYVDEELKEQVGNITIVNNGSIDPSLSGIVVSTYDGGVTTYTYRSNIDETDTSIPQDTFMLGLMGSRPQLPVEVWFEAADEAGNKATTSTFRTVYDKRSLFENVITVPASYTEDTSVTDISAKVFDISGAAVGAGITFEVTATDIKALIDAGAVYSVLLNGAENVTGTAYEVVLKDLKPGYYEAVGRVTGTAGETKVDLVSKAYAFYLTDGMNDDTLNRSVSSGNLVLNNRVYQLDEAAYYYFKSTNTSVGNFLYGAKYNADTGRYEGGSATPTFSSTVEAKKYVKFMEYRDLEVISITDAIASLLNGGSGSTIYVKAAKETKNALEGQLWIRYKKSSWTTTSNTSGWAFYYYGEGKVEDGINVNGLSENLRASIDAVTNRIVAAGHEQFLVGEDYTNRITAAPYLQDAQMHVLGENATKTMMGNTYVTNPSYAGDAALYSNEVTVENEKYPLATNMPLRVGASSALYFKYTGATEWTRIDAEDGTLLKDALSEQATGIYTIREYGEAGVGEFKVYLDRSLPLVDVTLNKDIAGEETHITLDGNITTITCKNLSLDQLVNEVDEQAYVAVYSFPGRALMTVLYGADIDGYLLSGSNYYLVVGDRSGNVVTYIVRTADSPISISVTENEAKTGVYVRIDNREAVEIYSYEVYLNETLIDNEFDTSKFFRGSGVYRIEVTDIYGNTEVRTITHEAPSPDLTWYYLNDNGGYSVYDPAKPVRMVTEDDPSSPRTTNVYASTMVRVLFNGVANYQDVEFEILDIPASEYTYNEVTGLLTFLTLASWRLRVWYKGQPENDRTYIFRVDNSAPEVGASVIGTTYHPYVAYDESGNVIETSTFDNINQDIYQEGDVVTLDTLTYIKDGQGTVNFSNGNVISGDHIVLLLTDSSGIRSVEVTRNGQPVEMELGVDNELTFHSYGRYVVKVTDNLGNVTTFTFINVEQEISSARVDDTGITQDVMAYGHDSFEILTDFDGINTILVEGEHGSYTYEFHNDNGVITYGQYYVYLVEREDEDGNPYTVKNSEYRQNDSFSFDRSSGLVKAGTWYTAIEADDFTISVMFDEDGFAHYKVTVVDKEIRVESKYSASETHLPNRFMSTLSREEPNVTILTGGQPAEKVPTLDYIYVTDDLTIDKASLPESIAEITVAYSQSKTIDEEPTVIYKDGQWLVDFVGKEFGYYRITVTNKYNNEKVYDINKITSFASVVTITCLDGSTVTYYKNADVICSNYAVDLLIMSTEVHFEVNGVVTSGYVEAGTTRLTLNRDGAYHVRVVGTNGIFEEFDFEIKNDEDFAFVEDWITGYNEEALLRDQGYTNALCSVHVGEDVVYIDMVVDDFRHYVLYDNITDEKFVDPDRLVEAIGRYGVGKYTIGFRNKYGDLVTHTVYYNNIPSITLTRTILSDPQTYQTYDIDLAIAKGFYSNNVLRFSTESTTYVFTVNGIEYRLDEPKIIEFSNVGGRGSFSYRITYRDEYGNYVEFDATLVRTDLEFDTTSMEIITVGGVDYTKDDVVIRFDDDLKATLSVDGGAARDYYSGETHYADGEYRFVVRDIAGNNVTYVIVHKSVNHYSLTNSKTGEEIIAGGVINDANVVFFADEGSRIKFVVRNGELVPDFNSTVFSLTGHYEILIEDAIGNQSYESFTILNNSLAAFDYTAPFEYEVTEVWRIAEDGTREMLNLRGPSIHLDVNGDYVVVVTSTKTASSFNFTVEINNLPPTAELSGVKNGEVTGRDVTITGLKVGDVVSVYKDGELISTVTITLSTDTPKITTGGKYRIVITNVQGVTKEFTFTRKAISNVAGSIFFIVSSVLVVIGLGIGLVYHTKLKTDD